VLDEDFPQYIHDNTDDEITRFTFLNGHLASKGAELLRALRQDIAEPAKLQLLTRSFSSGLNRRPRPAGGGRAMFFIRSSRIVFRNLNGSSTSDYTSNTTPKASARLKFRLTAAKTTAVYLAADAARRARFSVRL
jgi:hypothetical protein